MKNIIYGIKTQIKRHHLVERYLFLSNIQIILYNIICIISKQSTIVIISIII